MGAAAAKELAYESVGKGNLARSEAIDDVLSANANLKVNTKMGCFGRTESTIVDTASGATMYVCKAKCGFNTCTITVTDASGALICVAKGKKMLTTASFRVLTPSPAYAGQESVETVDAKGSRIKLKAGATLLSKESTPLFAFGEGKIKLGFGNASCTYGIVKAAGTVAPLYEAKKLRAMPFLLRLESAADGALVGKVAQLSMMDASKTAIEAGAGVDPVAFLIVSSLIGAATGSGGGAAVGAMAGAGAI